MKKLSAYLKTTVLLAGLTAIFVVIGYYWSGRVGIYYSISFALLFNFIAYWFSDKIILGMSNAKEANWKVLGGIESEVKDLCKKMGIPLPRLYIMESEQPNAFATGRNPENSVVCITTGIMNQLEPNQLIAVIAHELSHIRNYDVLIASLAAVIAGAISSLANMARWFNIFGGRDDEDRNPLAGIIMIITAPIIAMLLQFAISRSREYEADRTASEFTKKPEDLASALVAIDTSVKSVRMNVNPAFRSLYIHSPISGRGLSELFSTHPLTEKRVEKLSQMI